jgi:pyruvate/2-oxoglutarate dehydrogenase complex dihydrolipoamide dehydrogenase (E3) component
MPTRSFDVVILGGGNAGMGVTVATREAGLKVAMLEPDLLGGTCPNRGCMPKKYWSQPRTHSTRSSAPRPTTSRSARRASTGRR